MNILCNKYLSLSEQIKIIIKKYKLFKKCGCCIRKMSQCEGLKYYFCVTDIDVNIHNYLHNSYSTISFIIMTEFFINSITTKLKARGTYLRLSKYCKSI